MKFYKIGEKEKPVLMILPGTCCHWRMMEDVLPLLTPEFYVVCVSYDGFDETEQTTFPTMLEEIGKIEAYIQQEFSGRICAAYYFADYAS